MWLKLLNLRWLKINARIEYKLLSLTYKVLTTSQRDYLHNLISVQSSGRTRSSSVVTLDLRHYKSQTALLDRHHLTCESVLTIYHSLDLSFQA